MIIKNKRFPGKSKDECYTNTMDSTLFSQLLVGLTFFIDFVIRVGLVIYIPRKRKPTAATAWLLTIYILPIVGTILFFVFGGTKLSKKRRHDQKIINTLLASYTNELKKSNFHATVNPPYDTRAQLAESLTKLAPTGHNIVEILHGYDNLIAHMITAIDTATSYVYVEFFTMTLDTTTAAFFDALERAQARGVEVYVLFDTLGSNKYKGYKPMQTRLQTIGVQWRKILPISFKPGQYNRPDLRNHRKIVVVDNQHAYMGSLNMIDKTYHRKDDISYIELVAHLQGPSVNESAAVFASDWYSETGVLLKHFVTNSVATKKGSATVQIVPSGPGYPYQNNLRLFTSLIQSARTSVIITNPYLVPDESLLAVVTSAALRGVHVSILNSQAMDQWMVGHAQRSYYQEFLEAGVHIHLYKKPQLVHEKYMVIDDAVGVIGSSNFDIRSFELNHECVVVAYDQKTAITLTKRHEELLQHSSKINLKTWKKRSLRKEFLDSVARLTSAFQ